MIGYRIIQIRLMVDGEGVHDGFTKLLYHSIQVIGHFSSPGMAMNASPAFTLIGSVSSTQPPSPTVAVASRPSRLPVPGSNLKTFTCRPASTPSRWNRGMSRVLGKTEGEPGVLVKRSYHASVLGLRPVNALVDNILAGGSPGRMAKACRNSRIFPSAAYPSPPARAIISENGVRNRLADMSIQR